MRVLHSGRHAAAAVVLCAAGAVSACGGDDSEPAAESQPPKAVELSIDGEQYAQVRGEFAEVEGDVTPADATVEVDGLTADVTDGTWTARIRLHRVGENDVEVVASAPGREDATATTVIIRERTRAEAAAARARAAAARERRRVRSERAAQRAAERAAAQEAAKQTTVPSVIGERLDVAKTHLRDAGLGPRVIGGGTFGVIVESNWFVCSTEPGPEAPAEKGDRVRVIVDRDC